MPTRRSAEANAAWWLAAGEEVCPHCQEPYVYELEFRCTDCDGPGCMHCKELHVEGHYVCAACATAARAKPKRTAGRRARGR